MPETNPGHNGPPLLHNVIPELTLNRVKELYTHQFSWSKNGKFGHRDIWVNKDFQRFQGCNIQQRARQTAHLPSYEAK